MKGFEGHVGICWFEGLGPPNNLAFESCSAGVEEVHDATANPERSYWEEPCCTKSPKAKACTVRAYITRRGFGELLGFGVC